jgi:hypothetical protein
MDNKAYQNSESLPVSSKSDKRQKSHNQPTFGLVVWRDLLQEFIGKHQKIVNYGVLALLVILYHVYFVYSVIRCVGWSWITNYNANPALGMSRRIFLSLGVQKQKKQSDCVERYGALKCPRSGHTGVTPWPSLSSSLVSPGCVSSMDMYVQLEIRDHLLIIIGFEAIDH